MSSSRPSCRRVTTSTACPRWASSRQQWGRSTSVRAFAHFKRLLDGFRPDVVHVHNVFPLISPAVVNIAADAGIPVVQTLHNYRHACVNGLHLRDGKRCDDCIGTRTNWPAVRHGCYRGSRLQTIPMVASQHLHRRTWRRLSRVFALTDFMRDRAVLAGIPEQVIQIRPTWAPDPGPTRSPGSNVLYVGRLDEPKGVEAAVGRLGDEPSSGLAAPDLSATAHAWKGPNPGS